ncbi:MAG: FadR/GntR family transcriptional regulator [Mycetocola sp.]
MAHASHGTVLDDLGVRLAGGQIPAGAVLTLAGLEHEYGVSRTVIREAVRVLESIGVLSSRRRVGVTVQPMQDWNALDPALIRWRLAGPHRSQQLLELTELRYAVEPVASRLAAVRATASQRASLVHLAAQLQDLADQGLGDGDAYLEVDIAFHNLILEASGNAMLAATKLAIAEVLAGRARFGLTPAEPHTDATANHVMTAAAISAGHSEAAEQHSVGYLDVILSEVTEQAPQPDSH